jgi:single-strand DNA-binding protein
MYQSFIFSGTISNTPKIDEETGDFVALVHTNKSYTDANKELQVSVAKIILHVPGKIGEALFEKVEKGSRILVDGQVYGKDKGPIIREEKGKSIVFIEAKAFNVKVLGKAGKDEVSEDLFKNIIIGNVGKDPDMRYLSDAVTAVTNFSVAVNNVYKDKVTGENIKETIWFRVAAWGRQAEIANQYLRKGSRVCVDGALNFDPETGGPKMFTRTDGTPGASYEVTAFRVQLMDKKDEGPSIDSYQGPSSQPDDEDIPL